LQNLLRGKDFFRTVAAGLGGERNADGVADAGKEQWGKPGGGGDEALGAHAGLSEAEVQGVVAAGGKIGIDIDEVADAGDFGRQDDLVVPQTILFSGSGGVQGADDHGFYHDVAGRAGGGGFRVLVHHAGEQGLVQRAPVDADADGFLVFHRALDHGAEIVVVFAADGDVAGIDAVLGQSASGGGVLFEQQMAVVVEVAD